MKPWTSVDFPKLIREVRQPLCGQTDLTILGGKCTERDTVVFLDKWVGSVEMPFRIWEYVSEIVFQKDTLPHNNALLERGRIFGNGGDLMLRRDGVAFDWRFIGCAGIWPPDGDYGTQDYWESHPDMIFHQYNEKTLLWGEWNGEHWMENRVAAAELSYPEAGRRLRLHYKTFSRSGRVEFVWYTSLDEWKETDNG